MAAAMISAQPRKVTAQKNWNPTRSSGGSCSRGRERRDLKFAIKVTLPTAEAVIQAARQRRYLFPKYRGKHRLTKKTPHNQAAASAALFNGIERPVLKDPDDYPGRHAEPYLRTSYLHRHALSTFADIGITTPDTLRS
jgi:hypothetical protein